MRSTKLSSDDLFDSSNYKFVFVLIERLEQGNRFYVHYKGTRYTYSVIKKEVVEPREVNKLIVKADNLLSDKSRPGRSRDASSRTGWRRA